MDKRDWNCRTWITISQVKCHNYKCTAKVIPWEKNDIFMQHIIYFRRKTWSVFSYLSKFSTINAYIGKLFLLYEFAPDLIKIFLFSTFLSIDTVLKRMYYIYFTYILIYVWMCNFIISSQAMLATLLHPHSGVLSVSRIKVKVIALFWTLLEIAIAM